MTTSPPVEPRQRRTGRLLFWIAVAVTIIGWGPLFCTLGASWFATLNGCTLNEGDAHPCVVAGHDFGSSLYQLAMMGWLIIFSAPFAMAALGLWVSVLILALRKG